MSYFENIIFAYRFIGTCIFYIYIYLYVFEKGYFSKISNLSKISPTIKKILNYLNRILFRKFNIFPPWGLFTNLNEKFFYDLEVSTTTVSKKKYTWYVTRDARIGDFKLKRSNLVNGLLSHYQSNRNEIHKMCKKLTIDFLKNRNEVADIITIKNVKFDLHAEDKDIDSRNCKILNTNNLKTSFDFFWKNPKTNKANLLDRYKIL